MTDPTDDTELRNAARRRIQARTNAWRAAAGWVVLGLFFVAIWAFSGGGYFWPIWPILGTAVAVAYAFGNAYLATGVSESRVDAEVERMRNRR